MFKIGDSASIKHIIKEKDIQLFAEASGDYNPLHLDEEYANKSIFKKRIAHGMLSAAYISSVLGTQLPGEGSIYMSQSLKFIKPVFIGDEITTEVKITNIVNRKAYLETVCINQNNEKVTIGEAVILLPNEG